MPGASLSPRERAYSDIKSALLRGDFSAGQMLSLRELSAGWNATACCGCTRSAASR